MLHSLWERVRLFLVEGIAQIPGLRLVVALAPIISGWFTHHLVKDVSIGADAELSVVHQDRLIAPIRLTFSVENWSPDNITIDSTHLHIGLRWPDPALESIDWDRETVPEPPSTVFVEPIAAKDDGEFNIEFIPPRFLYYTSSARTLYVTGTVQVNTTFGKERVRVRASARIEEHHIKDDFYHVKDDLERGFSLPGESREEQPRWNSSL